MLETKSEKIIAAASGKLVLWTLLTALMASISYGIRKENDANVDWPGYATLSWIAFAYSMICLILTMKCGMCQLPQVASHALLACLFSGLVISQLCMGYVGIWKIIENPTNWQKMDISAIVFSAFAIASSYSLNSIVVNILAKQGCKQNKVTTEQIE